MNNTIDSTNSLKGIAILIVLINHYLNLNISGDSTGLANIWISVFFILSGYGIQHSLGKTFENETKYSAQPFFKFYYSRSIRIFPLFLVAYLTQSLIFQGDLSVFTILGIKAAGHFWFIPAIIQCYILAPFIHLLIKRFRIITLITLLLLFVLSNVYLHSNYAPNLLISFLKKVHLGWRNIFFLYIFLFSLSMFIPKIEYSWHKISNLEKYLYYFVFIGVVFFAMICVKFKYISPYLHDLSIKTIYPLLLITTSTIYFTLSQIRIPIISFIGKISYSIYLFHMIFYLSIDKFFGYGTDSVFELSITMISFLPFLYFCKNIEMLSIVAIKHFKLRKILHNQTFHRTR